MKKSNVEIRETWQGYSIKETGRGYGKHNLYLVKVYNNIATWSYDYTHEKHYKSRKRAEKIAEKIKAGIIQ